MSDEEETQPDLDKLLQQYERDTPNFFAVGESEIHYVPVEGGEIRVYHHKPKKAIYKRPIIFIPGFGTAAWIWREFHHTHHGLAEYFHIETRDKIGNRIKRHRKANFRIDQISKDIQSVIEYFNLQKSDYVLMAACMNGGAILNGLIKGYLNPPTTIALDPFTKWRQNILLVKLIMPILPPAILGALKFVIARAVMANMKNEAQKKRNMESIKGAVPWIWRKFSMQNVNYDLSEELEKITQEVFVIHGPKDKYHPEGTFKAIAEQIPYGRFCYLKVKEDQREHMAGVVASEFAKINKEDGLPNSLKPFEINLTRDN